LISQDASIGCTPTIDGSDPRVLHFPNSCAKTDNFKVKEKSGGPPRGQVVISGRKVFDVDCDGGADAPIQNFKILISPPDASGNTFACTSSLGIYGFIVNANSGSFAISEVMPAGWQSCDASTSQNVNVGSTNVVVPDFHNRCFLPLTGGRTKGFWHNKNGAAILAANDPAWRILLNSLNLVNADGSAFDIPLALSFADAHELLATYLTNGSNAGANMALQISAQLAAAALNVSAFGGVDGTLVIFVGANPCGITPFISINDLLAAANAFLAANPLIPPGDPDRPCGDFFIQNLTAINENSASVPAICPTSCP